MNRRTVKLVRIMPGAVLAVLLGLVLHATTLHAQDQPARTQDPEQLYRKAETAAQKGDYGQAVLYLAAYAESEPRRMKSDPAFAMKVRLRLWLWSLAAGTDENRLPRSLPGVPTSARGNLVNLWHKGCSPVKNREVMDLVGTWCGAGVTGEEDPLLGLRNLNPDLIKQFVDELGPGSVEPIGQQNVPCPGPGDHTFVTSNPLEPGEKHVYMLTYGSNGRSAIEACLNAEPKEGAIFKIYTLNDFNTSQVGEDSQILGLGTENKFEAADLTWSGEVIQFDPLVLVVEGAAGGLAPARYWLNLVGEGVSVALPVSD